MQVKDIMHSKPFTISSGLRCDEAVRLFLDHKVSGAPVVEGERLVGFLSEKDLFRAMFPNYKDFYETPEMGLDYEKLEQGARSASECLVSTVMSTRPLVTTPDMPLVKIGAQMVATGMHHVPVVEDGKIVGMVSRGDIYRAILKRYFVDSGAK